MPYIHTFLLPEWVTKLSLNFGKHHELVLVGFAIVNVPEGHTHLGVLRYWDLWREQPANHTLTVRWGQKCLHVVT